MQERDLINPGSLISSSSAAGSIANEQNVLGLNNASRPRFKPQLGSNSAAVPDITINNHPAAATVGAAGAGSGGAGGAPTPAALRCPRCDSNNTKFCYYNNYSLLQPRYFCKSCRRYWTKGGALRNVPVGGGCRKNKRMSRAAAVAHVQAAARVPGSVGGGGVHLNDHIGHHHHHQLIPGLPAGLSIGLQQHHHLQQQQLNSININNPDHHSHFDMSANPSALRGAAGLPPAPPLLYNFNPDQLNTNATANPNTSDHHNHGGTAAANPNSLLQQVLLDQHHHSSATGLLRRQLVAAPLMLSNSGASSVTPPGLINNGLINTQFHGSFNSNAADHFSTEQAINLQNPSVYGNSNPSSSREHAAAGNHDPSNLGFRAFNLGLDSFSASHDQPRDHWLKTEQKQQQMLLEQKSIHHSLASLDISAQNLNHQSLQDQAAISNYTHIRSASSLQQTPIKSEEGTSSSWAQNLAGAPHHEAAAANPSNTSTADHHHGNTSGTNNYWHQGGAPAAAGWQDLPGYNVPSTDHHHTPFM